MPHRPPRNRIASRRRILGLRIAALIGVAAISVGPLALAGFAAGSLTMNARIMLQGHARSGSWAAIQVDLQNDGPPIQGELQMDGGSQSNARYAMAVDLPTGSRQTYVLHAQPPAFGRNVKVDLVANSQIVESVTVAYLIHDATQLVVGVLAERPAGIVSEIHLPVNQSGTAPAIVPLTVSDLPERAEGWAVLDRLVWQDVDSNQLTSAQLEALRRWLAAGGRLIIVGGSAGIGTLSAFPDDILPYRPAATLDLDPSSLVSLLGQLPDGATSLPAMAGALAHGRSLAKSGDRVVAAELPYGSGKVTLLGFDPTTKWLGESKSIDALWRGVLPDRVSDGTQLVDDTQLVTAVYQLPLLQLPPTSGLLVIIAAYILIIGPINYLVLKRLDRRELAWITMPVLVLGFVAASFGYGALLRGTDVVINEVAIVHGAPDATEATAQVYFGIFSPSRSTYRVDVPQGALLAAPINADPFGQGASAVLDIVQGTGPERPSAVRNLSVGTGSIRVVRAELPVSAPRMRVQFELADGKLTGTFENASDEALEGVAVALGSSVAVLGDVAAHAIVQVSLPILDNPFGSSLADQVVGAAFDQSSEEGLRRSTRYAMVQQLTSDPTGQFNGTLPADQAVVLAFGRGQLLDLTVGSQQPRRNGNVLYYVPVAIGIHGKVTFTSDLLRPTVIDSDAQFFSKERFFLSMGSGKATLAYRPIAFEGTFGVTQIRLLLSSGGAQGTGAIGKEITPLASPPVLCTDSNNTIPAGCEARRNDGLPEIEVFDRTGDGTWMSLPRLTTEATYTLADPTRYVDPATGQMLVRFINDNPESTSGFGFQLALVGDVE
ncbi:MAG: hypothetical protein M3O77_06625 [Chloroflexota bacterium]|nr:hypothetical protein [Chloroflexota bacterium]